MTMYYVSREPERQEPERRARLRKAWKKILDVLATARRMPTRSLNRVLRGIGLIHASLVERANPIIRVITFAGVRNVYIATKIFKKFESTHQVILVNEVIERLSSELQKMRKGRRPSLSMATILADALMQRRTYSIFSDCCTGLPARYRYEYNGRDDLAKALQVILSTGPALMRDTPSSGRALEELFYILKSVEREKSIERDILRDPESGITVLIADRGISELYRHIGSAKYVSLHIKIRALRASARERASSGGPATAYEDLASAIALLPRLAWKESVLGAGDNVIGDGNYTMNSGLAADAAACAIAAGKPVRAIELLEAGRAIQLDTILRNNIELELYDISPKIARKLDRAIHHLDEHRRYNLNPFRTTIRYWEIIEQVADIPLRLTQARSQRRWDRLAKQAQEILPEATLRIPEFVRDIRPAAEDGPVILVIESQYGSFAAVIHSDSEEPLIVGLSDLTPESAREWAGRYLKSLENDISPEREGEVTEVLGWLWRTVASPALTAVIRALGETAPFRLWWCPSGILSALPIHAAFSADTDSQDCRSVLDLTISSYTPTARSLISSRKARDLRKSYPDSKEHKLDRLLLVSPGAVGGQEALPSAMRFRGDLAKLLPSDALVAITGEGVTCKKVERALWDQRRVHFDCHGVQSIEHPEKSGLVLQDGILAIEDVSLIRAYRPDFAFLASCSTAFPGTKFPDEAFSLTSAFQYGGYQHVIGTLSPALDGSARRVATSLYKNIIADGRLDPALSAEFLRTAILAERSKHSAYPSTWIPFVHVGI